MSRRDKIGLQKALLEPYTEPYSSPSPPHLPTTSPPPPYGQVHAGLAIRTLISASVLPETTGRLVCELA